MKKTLKTILTILAVLAAIAGICAAAYLIYKKYFADEEIDLDADDPSCGPEEVVVIGKRNYISLRPKKKEEAESI